MMRTRNAMMMMMIPRHEALSFGIGHDVVNAYEQLHTRMQTLQRAVGSHWVNYHESYTRLPVQGHGRGGVQHIT